MKISQLLQLNKTKIFEGLLFLTILTIPLYQFRIDIFSVSLSCLSLTEIILIIFGFLIYFKSFLKTYSLYSYFFNLIIVMLFFLSFISILVNNIHSYGILLEWFILPITTSFFIFIYLIKNPIGMLRLKKMLALLLAIIIAFSLYYFFTHQLTFDNRLKAFYSSPNQLAMIILPLFFITLDLFHFNKKSLTKKSVIKKINSSSKIKIKEKKLQKKKNLTQYFISLNWSKIFLLILLISSFFILFQTNSLLNIFLTTLGLLIYLIYFYRHWLILILSGSLIIIALSLTIQHKITDWSNFLNLAEKNSLISRLVIYDVSFNLIRPQLLTGSKLTNFQDEYLAQQLFYSPYPEWAVPTPHNFILMNLFSAGLIFNFIFLLIFARWFFELFKNNKMKNNKIQKRVKAEKINSISLPFFQFSTLFFLILIIFLIFWQGILDTPYWKNDLALIFWLVIILGLAERKLLNEK
jgi:O-antigen ligase